MNILKNTELLNEVKEILDNATWDYTYNQNHDTSGAENAISYLDTQKFSIKKIKDAIDCHGFIEEESVDIDPDDKAKFIAELIASYIASDRICNFVLSYSEMRFSDSKKWYINDTVTFCIR